MRKKSIGEVIQLARLRKNISLEQMSQQTGIALKFLKNVEENNFDALPGPFYVKKTLTSYAELVDLDKQILWEAYETGNMLTYDEIEIDSEEVFPKRQERKNHSYLPFYYLVSIALLIIAGMIYYTWNFLQVNKNNSTTTSYKVATTNTVVSESKTNQSTVSSTSDTSSKLSISQEGGGNNLTVSVKGADSPVLLTLTVENTTSWISVSDTELAGGITLSADNPSQSVNLAPNTTSKIQIGVVKGINIKINGQIVDLSNLTSNPAVVTIKIN
ncbi:helix-turn-helix domain-containing protein [Streptococcus massiliensis]|uniref:Transcriptional regulation protein n=1 Tax=Streptococcus massiliensis TaxID=313439 RepID=A0A380KWK4_9STRE|nr:helix-turn-helix domain-containing protein [Streptococcus massiliensis]SUN76312.1 transcriptional regulation protein [Streptococcus massiliensis]